MTYGLDTTVIMRLLLGEPPELAQKVSEHFAEHRDAGDTFFVSDLAISEAYFALQRHYSMTKENAILALRSLAEEEGISLTPEAEAALATPDVWKASPGFVDRMIANGYAARSQVTLSCEKDFRRLDLAEVIS